MQSIAPEPLEVYAQQQGRDSYEAVPVELRSDPQWLNWRYENRGGPKPTKVPYSARTGRLGSSTDQSTWSTFDEALQGLKRWRADGIGYALRPGSGVVGIDLDDCIDASGQFAEWAQAIVERIDSYTEVSPSGRGVRIFLYGALPGSGHSKKLHKVDAEQYPGENAAVEAYSEGRFLTVTGRHIPWTPTVLKQRQDALAAVHNEFWPPAPPAVTTLRAQTLPVDLSDRERLERMFAAKNGADVRALWDGDISRHGGDESAADLALMNALAFWAACDPTRMEAMFSQSALGQREKWRDRADYRERTIRKAIDSCSEVYSGRGITNWPEHSIVPEMAPGDGSCPTCAMLRAKLERVEGELEQLRARHSLTAAVLRRPDYKPVDKLVTLALLNQQTAAESQGKSGPLRVIVDQLERTEDNVDWIDSSLVAMTGTPASTIHRSMRRVVPIDGSGYWRRHYEVYHTDDGTPHQRLYVVPANSAPEQWVTIATAAPPAEDDAPPKPPSVRRTPRCKRHPFAKITKETTWRCTTCGRHCQEPHRETLDPTDDPPISQIDNQATGEAEPGPAPGRSSEEFAFDFPDFHFDNQAGGAAPHVEVRTKPSQIEHLAVRRVCAGCGEGERDGLSTLVDVNGFLLHHDCTLPVGVAS